MNKIKIYLAAPWTRKDEAIAARTVLQDADFEVTSRWLEASGDFAKDGYDSNEAYFEAQAIHDVQDILNANVLVMLNLEYSEGKMFELGLAMGLNRPTILVGEKTHTFHYLPFPKVPDLNGAIEIINKWKADYEKAQLMKELSSNIIEGEIVLTDADGN